MINKSEKPERVTLMASALIQKLLDEVLTHGDKPVILEDPDTAWEMDLEYGGLTHSNKNILLKAHEGGYGYELNDKDV